MHTKLQLLLQCKKRRQKSKRDCTNKTRDKERFKRIKLDCTSSIKTGEKRERERERVKLRDLEE